MGILETLRRLGTPSKSVSRVDAEPLFDEAFQRKLDSLALISKRVVAGRMRAERRTKKTGAGVEFADHRAYQPGDDFRYLDWNAYQRFDRLLLRLFEEEEDLAVYFVIDASQSMGFGDGRKLRYAKRVVAALAYVALAHLDRVSLLSTSDRIEHRVPPMRGKARIFRVFRFLEGITPLGSTNLESALQAFVAENKRRGLVVVVSDLFDPSGFERGLNVLRYNRFEPFVVHVRDPEEASPAIRGDVLLYDCETGTECEITVTPAVLKRYGEAYRSYVAAIERFCASSHVPYVSADVSVPVEELILRVFRRGGFLR